MTANTWRKAVATIGCACALLTGCGDDGGGGNEKRRALPQVTGLALSAAEQRLEKVNVGWTFQEDGGKVFRTAQESSGTVNSARAGRQVAAQDPKPGTRIISGDVVLLKLRR